MNRAADGIACLSANGFTQETRVFSKSLNRLAILFQSKIPGILAKEAGQFETRLNLCAFTGLQIRRIVLPERSTTHGIAERLASKAE